MPSSLFQSIMKQSFIDKHFDTIFGTFVVVGLTFVFVGLPVAAWYSAGVEQKAINTECGTNYSRVDVLFSSEGLTELCRIKSQQLTLKK
jgi:hypothetical protein